MAFRALLRGCVALPWLLLLAAGPVQAADIGGRVKVTAPFIELHTGPGPGYPIFYVVDRDQWVTIEERRTDWFRVTTEAGKQGWVSLEQIERTVDADGAPTRFRRMTLADFTDRRWEMGVLYGVLDEVDLVSLYGGYAFTRNLSLELWLQQALGKFSSSYLVDLGLVHQPFPEWRVSPFFGVGGGVIHTSTSASLVQSSDTTDETLHVAAGVRAYLTRRFMLRAEYREYVVLTSRNENEEIEKWQLGVAFFF